MTLQTWRCGMDKSLVDRLEKLEQRTAEHSDASLLSNEELMKIISDDLGYVPTDLEIVQMFVDDSDAGEGRTE